MGGNCVAASTLTLTRRHSIEEACGLSRPHFGHHTLRDFCASAFSRSISRHFNSIAQKVGYAPTAEPIIEGLLIRTPAVIAEVQAELPEDFSPRVADAILGGLAQAAKTLGGMVP